MISRAESTPCSRSGKRKRGVAKESILLRAKLIKKGMIYSPGCGDLAFTVPPCDEFMIRAIPVFERKY
jgi:hypothetical protein